MNKEVYQVLCRNIEVCASSILASYKALNNPKKDNIEIALAASIIRPSEVSPSISKEDSLNILLNAESLLKEVLYEIQNISQL